MIIYLDVDEVLADFVGGACRLHGTTAEQLAEIRSPGEWDITKPLGLTGRQFWAPINEAGATFWRDLELLPWWENLMDCVEDFVGVGGYYLVTAPGGCPSSYVGKVEWIRRHFGIRFNNYIITQHKELLAKEDRILVDDRVHNLEVFIKHGGRSVVFPSLGNHHHEMADAPVDYVRGALAGIIYSQE